MIRDELLELLKKIAGEPGQIRAVLVDKDKPMSNTVPLLWEYDALMFEWWARSRMMPSLDAKGYVIRLQDGKFMLDHPWRVVGEPPLRFTEIGEAAVAAEKMERTRSIPLVEEIPAPSPARLKWTYHESGEHGGEFTADSAMVKDKEKLKLPWQRGFHIQLFPSGDWGLSHPWRTAGNPDFRAPVWFKSIFEAFAEAERMEQTQKRFAQKQENPVPSDELITAARRLRYDMTYLRNTDDVAGTLEAMERNLKHLLRVAGA